MPLPQEARIIGFGVAMGMFAIGKAGLALACAGLIAACSNRHPSESSAAGPIADPQATVAERALHAAQSAADFHASLTSLDRIAGMMRAAADTGAIAPPAAAFRGYGAGPAAPEPLAGQPSMLAALIKASASARPARLGPVPHGRASLAKSAAGGAAAGKRAAGSQDMADDEAPPDVSFEGDTAWFNYSDSARGKVHWIHVFRDPDWGVLSVVRDSLSYQWPCYDSTPILISSSTSMRPFYGGEFRLELSDEDGDGALNSARSGGSVRIRKLWRQAAGDTVRKSVWLLDHGAAMEGGGLAEGLPRTFTDTTWIKGKAVAWSTAWDGDGDGLALEAAPGRALVVRTEAFAAEADGRRTYTRIAAGAGPDGDWFSAADNAWVRYGRTLLSAAGDTLSHWDAGDADGDGYYFDPAAAANRVWETHRYPCTAGCASYRDSVVKSLGDLSDPGDDRIVSATARLRWDDGSETAMRSVPEKGGADFGSGDTVAVRETRVWPESRAAGDPDSLIREFRLAVGFLADPSDDRAEGVSIRAWFGAGAAWERTGQWHSGARMRYTAALAGGRNASGTYDAATGDFSDTVFRADGGRDIHAGAYVAADGKAEYTARREGLAEARVKVERAGDGYAIESIAEGNTARYAQRGDSTSWVRGVAQGSLGHIAVADTEGGYRIALVEMDRDGVAGAEGAFTFAAGGAGEGWMEDKAEGRGVRRGFRVGANGKAVPATSANLVAVKP